MNFFEHQEAARKRTAWLVVFFVIAVIAIVAAVNLAVIIVFGLAGTQAKDSPELDPSVLGVISLITVALIVVGSLYKTAQLAGGGDTVAVMMGGRLVSPNTPVLRERVLLNVVEEMAIASGTPVPRVYLLEQESAINAFAAGTTPQNAVIGVTRGTIDSLSRDELQGVIAHEFSHILNGDMKLNLRLIGLLHGILLIAMIGYFLLRTSSRTVRTSSNSKKGGNPLPLLGLLLLIIGYIGVFFGNLIKSAVSRQREFLADASAVQFTRYPQGIAGALKKIGGLSASSTLQNPHAQEASHLFFGNALSEGFSSLLSTHPPLPDRISRIDPSFDGKFPPTRLVNYSARDIVEPHALASRLAESPAPVTRVQQNQASTREHIEYAAGVINALPPQVLSEARDPLGAIAVIYALLLDGRDPGIRRQQVDYLNEKADPRAVNETQRVASLVSGLQPEARLPLVALVLPALRELSPAQRKAFAADVVFLVKADRAFSLFEYAVRRMVLKRLLPQIDNSVAVPARGSDPQATLRSVIGLLSTLAHEGTDDPQQAARIFLAGAARFTADARSLTMLPANECGFRVIDAALDQLSLASLKVKQRVIEACTEAIIRDGQVSVDEAELLRVISDALDCPMPPIVGLKKQSST
jgi:Zn-dependent protease with chaperone function